LLRILKKTKDFGPSNFSLLHPPCSGELQTVSLQRHFAAAKITLNSRRIWRRHIGWATRIRT
jgi:hypothetical protein